MTMAELLAGGKKADPDAGLCVLFGVPIGFAMSRNDRLQKIIIPILDMLQTLPTFVYLIPLIFLFSVTESKLYGIAIIL